MRTISSKMMGVVLVTGVWVLMSSTEVRADSGTVDTVKVGNFVPGTNGVIDVINAAGTDTIILNSTGTGTITSGTVNASSVGATTLGVTGLSSLSGGEVVNNGATISSGVAAGNQVVVDATSSRLVSASGLNSVEVNNTAANVTAGNNALIVGATSASLQVQNTTTGISHGVSVGQTSTVISGGTNSTNMTLDNNGATFANASAGGPAQVHGVADGSADNDAVNRRQLNQVETRANAGIASVAALAAIPGPVAGKNYAIGAGVGSYGGQEALALGVNTIVGSKRDISLRAGLGFSHDQLTTNAGLSWSF